MLSYRTEIVVATDRRVTLQLPDHFPEGRATVVVSAPSARPDDPGDHDPDREDIEWWDEFDDEAGPGR